MKTTKPFQHHADAVRSDAFTGNVPRTARPPGEIAGPPLSQATRADTVRGSERPWWFWPAVAAALVFAASKLLAALSASGVVSLAH